MNTLEKILSALVVILMSATAFSYYKYLECMKMPDFTPPTGQLKKIVGFQPLFKFHVQCDKKPLDNTGNVSNNACTIIDFEEIKGNQIVIDTKTPGYQGGPGLEFGIKWHESIEFYVDISQPKHFKPTLSNNTVTYTFPPIQISRIAFPKSQSPYISNRGWGDDENHLKDLALNKETFTDHKLFNYLKENEDNIKGLIETEFKAIINAMLVELNIQSAYTIQIIWE